MPRFGGGGAGGAGGAVPDPIAFGINALVGLGIVADIMKNSSPSLEDEVVVEVIGQPGASKQQLYFLALSAASSVARQILPLNSLVSFFAPSAGMLMIEYDAADNWVRCTLKYQSGMTMNMMAATAETAVGTGVPLFNRLAVLRGPSCNLIGAPFGFLTVSFGGIIGGLVSRVVEVVVSSVTLNGIVPGPVARAVAGAAAATVRAVLTTTLNSIDMIGTFGMPAAGNGAAPSLPFTGQTILTSCPTVPRPTPGVITNPPVPDSPLTGVGNTIISPNPMPPGDNRSRGVVITPPPIQTAVLRGGRAPTGVLVSGPTGVARRPIPTPPCCDKSTALVPLIYAALSAPGTNSKQTFPPPDGTVLGK